MFEQLGEHRLERRTTISGKNDSHAVRLDNVKLWKPSASQTSPESSDDYFLRIERRDVSRKATPSPVVAEPEVDLAMWKPCLRPLLIPATT
jgi:hypothetical protein